MVVFGRPNPILGSTVCARFQLAEEEPAPAFRVRMRAFCEGRLQRFQIPQKVELTTTSLVGRRFKKLRSGSASEPTVTSTAPGETP